MRPSSRLPHFCAVARLLCLLAGALLLGEPTAAAAEAEGAGVEAPDWGLVSEPSPAPARAIGGHALGCLGGAVELPATGAGYQVMRPSRNRAYGHPELVAFVKSFAKKARADGWPGLLIGDMAQPRGGPIATGHASHQSGLDVDIWFTPAPPKRTLSVAERDVMSAVSMVAAAGGTVDAKAWSQAHVRLLRLAAGAAGVERIFVNAAIKKAACAAAGKDRRWLAKLRPWWGHTHHFHVRLSCPAGEPTCVNQEPVPAEDGCDASLEWWFSAEAEAKARAQSPAEPRRILLADLPPACRGVLNGG